MFVYRLQEKKKMHFFGIFRYSEWRVSVIVLVPKKAAAALKEASDERDEKGYRLKIFGKGGGHGRYL